MVSFEHMLSDFHGLTSSALCLGPLAAMSAYDAIVMEDAGGGVFEIVERRARKRGGTVEMRGIQLQLTTRY
jgi:hypothetical protein